MGNSANKEATVKEVPADEVPVEEVLVGEDVPAGEDFKIPACNIVPLIEGDEIETAYAPLPKGIIMTGGEKLREKGYKGKGVKVAVIDSGVDKDHPSFDGKVTKQVWYRKGTPLSEDFHGTHVAGTVHFMAPEAEIYDYRVFGSSGTHSVVQAIEAAIDQAIVDGCRVINMSLGGPAPFGPIEEAVKRAHAAGIIIVCAAGNEGDGNTLTNEVSYPASYEQCISVAAVQKKDGLPVANFSNSNVQVDYSGIGVNVLSLKPGGELMRLNGTSMASPHVAGLVACILSDAPTGSKPGDEVVTESEPNRMSLYLCCSRKSTPATTSAPSSEPISIFTEVSDDASFRKYANENLAIDIGIKGPDNSTGIGFLTYLSEEELKVALETL